jgi:quinol monooxygenase YgiN
MHKMLVTLKEPGCVSFDVYVPTDGRETYVAIECFQDENAYAEHGNMAHTKEFLPLLLASVESIRMEIVKPAG